MHVLLLQSFEDLEMEEPSQSALTPEVSQSLHTKLLLLQRLQADNMSSKHLALLVPLNIPFTF